MLKNIPYFSITLFTILAVEFIVNGLAIMLAKALNTEDVVTIMAQTAAGIGLLAITFSTLRINELNLYSSSLSIANVVEILAGKKLSYTIITLVIGLGLLLTSHPDDSVSVIGLYSTPHTVVAKR